MKNFQVPKFVSEFPAYEAAAGTPAPESLETVARGQHRFRIHCDAFFVAVIFVKLLGQVEGAVRTLIPA